MARPRRPPGPASGRAGQQDRLGTAASGELRQALLPSDLPVLPRARLAARCLLAADGQAGGDWFDAIPRADGTVALMVGTVPGSGIAAAAAMSRLRAVFDELLTTEADLETALRRADAFAARSPSLRPATLVLAVLDPADGTLRYASCGHPPPLIAGTGPAATRYLSAAGTGPLGTGCQLALAADVLRPGELLLLYSDGLIERPARTLTQSLAELADAAAGTAGGGHGAATLTDQVCQLAEAEQIRTTCARDSFVLAAQQLAVAVPPLLLSLPAELGSVTRVRLAIDQWLSEIGAGTADRGDLRLAVVEIVANAVEHAYPAGQPGSIEVEARLRGDGNVECRIADYGSWSTPDPAAADRGHGLMVAGQVVDQMRVRHPRQAPAAAPDVPGTVVLLQRRLRTPAMFGPGAVAARMRPAGPPFAAEPGLSSAGARVRVTGTIDASSASRLARELLIASRGGTLPLTVDLTGVTDLASAGVRAFYRVRDQLSAHEQSLTLIATPGSPAGR